ncbi:AAA family ATPase [Marinivivus vitaminiproducens]|uniref:AAA family ATPase n=1 Tax=Marinivivus vitaminiproducens TaxID=3035935 RepID=UPI0027AA6480|nr:AAA family ATPase [Geminicoccaceae bacterium SCSIO 64248]
MAVATLERVKAKPTLDALLKRHEIQIVRANHLMAAELPEPVFTVPGIVTPGLTVLAGRPKLGKSWLAFGLADAVARGGYAMGKIKVDPGPVLYLALEDTHRRLQSRLNMMLLTGDASRDLSMATEWPPLDQGGLELIEAWIQSELGARMVIIDTWAKVRPERKRDQNVYEGDYAAASPLKKLGDRHGVAIVIVHHTRKMEAADWLDSVSGSTGLTGAADNILVLTRKRGETDATLGVTGRDIEETEKALRFDKHTGMWELLGEAADFRRTEARQEILDALEENESLTRSDLVEMTGKSKQAVSNLLSKLVKEGRITAAGSTHRRRYTVSKCLTEDNDDESEAYLDTSHYREPCLSVQPEDLDTWTPHNLKPVSNAKSLVSNAKSQVRHLDTDFSSPQPLPPGMKPGQRNGGQS